jgi:hypothetical protein
MSEAGRSWWGDYRLAIGEAGSWWIGPLALRVQHTEGEWSVGLLRDASHEGTLEIRSPHHVVPIAKDFEVQSFAVSTNYEKLTLTPVLPNRSLVVRTEPRLAVPPNEEVLLRIRAPLGVRVSIGDPAKVLLEVPTEILQPTWFGPSPTVGDLCYALRTSGRLGAGEPPPTHQATALVKIHNRASSSLLIERINLPMAALRVFAKADGSLWTNGLTLQRDSDQEVTVKVDAAGTGDGDPVIAVDGRAVTDSVFMRAFSSLFR